MDEILAPVTTAMQGVQTAAAEAASAIVADANLGSEPFWRAAAERVLTAAIVRAAADGQRLNLPRVGEVLRGWYHDPDADIGPAGVSLDLRVRVNVLATVEVVLARAAKAA